MGLSPDIIEDILSLGRVRLLADLLLTVTSAACA